MRFLVIFFFILMPKIVLGSDYKEVSTKIKGLREKQIRSSISDYYELEKKIQEIKKDFFGKEVPRISKSSNILMLLVHLFPFIFWQILFISALIFLIFFRFSFLMFLLLFVSSFALYGGYVERFSEWHVVEEETLFLRLGPKINYPIRNKLFPLDELKVKRKIENDEGKWMMVERRGVSGWFKYD